MIAVWIGVSRFTVTQSVHVVTFFIHIRKTAVAFLLTLVTIVTKITTCKKNESKLFYF